MSTSCGSTTTGSATTTSSAPAAKAPAPAPQTPDETAGHGQKNARESAEGYLQTGAFSRTGLIKQLSSQYGEGFSKADAIYAVDHVDVNWNEQAVKASKAYLDVARSPAPA
jgi:hypothetical protein